MKLTDLDPHWLTDVHTGGYSIDEVGTASGAQGIKFLCPQHFNGNRFEPESHYVMILFSARGVADDVYPELSRRVALAGDDYSTLTIKPLVDNDCGWLGSIVHGEVSTL